MIRIYKQIYVILVNQIIFTFIYIIIYIIQILIIIKIIRRIIKKFFKSWKVASLCKEHYLIAFNGNY